MRAQYEKRHQSPWVLTSLSITISTAFLIAVAWLLYSASETSRLTTRHAIEIERLKGKIMLYDEILTSSARMGAATGDHRWETRYIQNEQPLDEAIKSVISIAPETSSGVDASETDAANIKLVKMEKRSFELIKSGDWQAARTLLLSPEYEKQKETYATGMKAMTTRLDAYLEKSMDNNHDRFELALSFAVGMIPISILIWIYTWVSLKKWRMYVYKVNADLFVCFFYTAASVAGLQKGAPLTFALRQACPQGRLSHVNSCFQKSRAIPFQFQA